MRREKPSITAALVAAVRAAYAEAPEPLRLDADPGRAALVPRALRWPAGALRHAPWAASPLLRMARAASLGLTEHVALRTFAIDDALRDALRAGARSVVLLGAGLDDRAARLPELSRIRVFEIDHPAMQRDKRARLARASGDERSAPRVFVPVDFERERLADALASAGLDREAPSFWIWEGVTVYLTASAMTATLDAVTTIAAPGSRLAVTYTEPDVPRHVALDAVVRLAARAVGEPLRGTIARGDLARLAARAGFDVLSDEDDDAWRPRYAPGTARLGPPWERLLVAERRRDP